MFIQGLTLPLPTTNLISVSTVILFPGFSYLISICRISNLFCHLVMSKFERKAGEKTKEQLLTLLSNKSFLDSVADDKLNSTIASKIGGQA